MNQIRYESVFNKIDIYNNRASLYETKGKYNDILFNNVERSAINDIIVEIQQHIFENAYLEYLNEGFIKDMFNKGVDKAKEIVTDIKDKSAEIGTNIKNKAVQLTGKAKVAYDFCTTILNKGISKVSELIHFFVELLSKLADTVKTAIKKLGGFDNDDEEKEILSYVGKYVLERYNDKSLNEGLLDDLYDKVLKNKFMEVVLAGKYKGEKLSKWKTFLVSMVGSLVLTLLVSTVGTLLGLSFPTITIISGAVTIIWSLRSIIKVLLNRKAEMRRTGATKLWTKSVIIQILIICGVLVFVRIPCVQEFISGIVNAGVDKACLLVGDGVQKFVDMFSVNDTVEHVELVIKDNGLSGEHVSGAVDTDYISGQIHDMNLPGSASGKQWLEPDGIMQKIFNGDPSKFGIAEHHFSTNCFYKGGFDGIWNDFQSEIIAQCKLAGMSDEQINNLLSDRVSGAANSGAHMFWYGVWPCDGEEGEIFMNSVETVCNNHDITFEYTDLGSSVAEPEVVTEVTKETVSMVPWVVGISPMYTKAAGKMRICLGSEEDEHNDTDHGIEKRQWMVVSNIKEMTVQEAKDLAEKSKINPNTVGLNKLKDLDDKDSLYNKDVALLSDKKIEEASKPKEEKSDIEKLAEDPKNDKCLVFFTQYERKKGGEKPTDDEKEEMTKPNKLDDDKTKAQKETNSVFWNNMDISQLYDDKSDDDDKKDNDGDKKDNDGDKKDNKKDDKNNDEYEMVLIPIVMFHYKTMYALDLIDVPLLHTRKEPYYFKGMFLHLSIIPLKENDTETGTLIGKMLTDMLYNSVIGNLNLKLKAISKSSWKDRIIGKKDKNGDRVKSKKWVVDETADNDKNRKELGYFSNNELIEMANDKNEVYKYFGAGYQKDIIKNTTNSEKHDTKKGQVAEEDLKFVKEVLLPVIECKDTDVYKELAKNDDIKKMFMDNDGNWRTVELNGKKINILLTGSLPTLISRSPQAFLKKTNVSISDYIKSMFVKKYSVKQEKNAIKAGMAVQHLTEIILKYYRNNEGWKKQLELALVPVEKKDNDNDNNKDNNKDDNKTNTNLPTVILDTNGNGLMAVIPVTQGESLPAPYKSDDGKYLPTLVIDQKNKSAKLRQSGVDKEDKLDNDLASKYYKWMVKNAEDAKIIEDDDTKVITYNEHSTNNDSSTNNDDKVYTPYEEIPNDKEERKDEEKKDKKERTDKAEKQMLDAETWYNEKVIPALTEKDSPLYKRLVKYDLTKDYFYKKNGEPKMARLKDKYLILLLHEQKNNKEFNDPDWDKIEQMMIKGYKKGTKGEGAEKAKKWASNRVVAISELFSIIQEYRSKGKVHESLRRYRPILFNW